MSKAMETTLCLNSFNRDIKIYPEPNDFVLDLKGRYEVQFAAIGSMELPLSQYTIESDWGTFGFDVGSSLSLHTACRSMTLRTESGDHSAVVLPAPWLGVESLGGGSWKTVGGVPHGLSDNVVAMSSVEGFGAAVLSTTEPDDPKTVVSCVDDATVHAPSAVAPAGTQGALLVQNAGVRSFASPAQLALVLNARFSALNWPLYVEWSQEGARATLFATAPGLSALVSPSSFLLRSLGFLCRDGVVPIFYGGPSAVGCSLPFRPELLVSDNFPLGARVSATFDPGHYDPSSFRSAAEALLNPLSVVGVVPPSTMVVEEWGVAPVGVPIAGARYFHPLGIARHISAALATAGSPVYLAYEDNSRFVFRTTGTLPFVVAWGPSPPDQDLAQRLGFEGSATQLGLEAAGLKRAYADIPTSVTMPVAFDSVSINLQRRFVMVPKARVQRTSLAPPGLTVTSDGVSSLTAPAGDVPLEYMVLIGGGAAALAVATHIDHNNLVQLVPLSGAVPPAGVYPSTIVPATGGALNMYFLLPPRACFSRLAEIFGFPQGTTSGFAPQGLHAPYSWNFEPTPPYVLVELGIQHMSALLSHRCREDIKSNLIAKIPLFPSFKVERGYPMSRSGTGVSYITQLHVLLLNPWHQPVRFHGREWSFTLILGSSQRAAHTECP